MIECTIDTHVLADLLMQYSSGQPNSIFYESEFLTKGILSKVNTCIESKGYEGIVVASTFAFIELINQFTVASKGKFELSKVIGIINQPPDWFVIEPYTPQTVYNLIFVPKYNSVGESIELADAIHVATAMQRGPNTYLATHDGILSRINYDYLGVRHLI